MPAILASASLKMDAQTEGGECLGTFALVAYIQGPLGTFLNDLRRRLDPGSEPKAHITLLPPRQLNGTAEEAQEQIRELIPHLHPFHLELTRIEVFPSTHVVFVEPGVGRTCLLDIHAALNHRALFYDEPYVYHPHVTLVQFQPPEAVGEKTLDARASWSAYSGPRQVTVSRLTFVKHAGGNQWVDLESFDLLD